jgi:hypothetical protein
MCQTIYSNIAIFLEAMPFLLIFRGNAMRTAKNLGIYLEGLFGFVVLNSIDFKTAI